MLTIKAVLKEFADADKIELADGNILTVRHYDGWISQCSQSEKLIEYQKQGHIRSKFYKNLYGHTDYFFI